MNLTINTDGGARGNPGPGACGVVIKTDLGELQTSFSLYLGIVTNNQAEYQGVVAGLNYLQDNLEQLKEVQTVTFVLDSELVVRQLLRVYKLKSPELINLYNQIQSLIDGLPFEIKFTHVKRAYNHEADKLVNFELDKLRV